MPDLPVPGLYLRKCNCTVANCILNPANLLWKMGSTTLNLKILKMISEIQVSVCEVQVKKWCEHERIYRMQSEISRDPCRFRQISDSIFH